MGPPSARLRRHQPARANARDTYGCRPWTAGRRKHRYRKRLFRTRIPTIAPTPTSAPSPTSSAASPRTMKPWWRSSSIACRTTSRSTPTTPGRTHWTSVKTTPPAPAQPRCSIRNNIRLDYGNSNQNVPNRLTIYAVADSPWHVQRAARLPAERLPTCTRLPDAERSALLGRHQRIIVEAVPHRIDHAAVDHQHQLVQRKRRS